MKSVRITLEELENGQPIKDSLRRQFEFEKFESFQDIGYNRTFKEGSNLVDIKHNGQRRMKIKLWTGCPTYESIDLGNR